MFTLDWGAELGSAALTVEPPHSWRRQLRVGDGKKGLGKGVDAPTQTACALVPLVAASVPRPLSFHLFESRNPGTYISFLRNICHPEFSTCGRPQKRSWNAFRPNEMGLPSLSKAGLELGAFEEGRFIFSLGFGRGLGGLSG